ncbi:MAG: hypothetical protein A2275_08745 [Bacteroidetes bacterium RIFOXYA12_FULL_35_11]|nr:MAG: hypothetical protein A2275_08745 [Bacteroidetes bacterium RIFOXYA12_FULL_35_11]
MKMIEIEKCDHIICLGDILGYPYRRAKYENTKNADECINIIKSNCSIVLLGNHDLFHLKKFPEYQSGFNLPENWYQLSAEEKRHFAGDHVWNYSDDYSVEIQPRNKEYMMSLSEHAIKSFGSQSVLFSHFVYPNFTGYIASYSGDGKKIKKHFDFMKKANCELSICGHLHMEGLGICYGPGESLLTHIFKGFIYFSYGEKKIKGKSSCVSIPALADNGQVNGIAVLDMNNAIVKSISLNTNRRFIL